MFEAPWSAVLFKWTARDDIGMRISFSGRAVALAALTRILAGNGEPRQDEIWPQRLPHSELCADVPYRTRSILAVRCRPGSYFR